MPKVQFSDVTPPERRSIRNIPIPNSGRRARLSAETQETKGSYGGNSPGSPVNKIPIQTFSRPSEQSYYHEDRHPSDKSKKKYVYGFIAIVLIVGFIGFMMTVFASASVSVVPKSDPIAVILDLTASREVATSSVKYEVIKITKQKNVSVEATGEEMLERKASGKIIIYNDYSPEPQRLITRTRFETKDGLIYRIPESIVVPGKTSNGPGQIEVAVFADEAGEKYNIGKADFTVPGFKHDTARYSKFYARGTTEMQGGFIGKVKKVEESTKLAAIATLEADLKSEVEKELATQIPEGLVSLGNSIIYEFKELAQSDLSSSATLNREVTAYAIMLRKSDLSSKIISAFLSDAEEWQNIPAVVKDFSGLAITLGSTGLNEDPINIKLEGSVVAVADIDTKKLAETLTKLPRASISEAMKSYPGIETIKAAIRPIWKKSFPDRADKIYVEISG